MSVVIRDAVRGDVPVVLQFIRALADYERLSHEVEATTADIERELFGPSPKVFCQLAEVEGKPAGFALWYYTFSTFQGRHGIWLEDLFVNPDMRGHGVGKALLASIDFYVSQGAVFLDDWRRCRVTGTALDKLGAAA